MNFARLGKSIKQGLLRNVAHNFPLPPGYAWKKDLAQRFYLLLCVDCAAKPTGELVDGEQPIVGPVVVPIQPPEDKRQCEDPNLVSIL